MKTKILASTLAASITLLPVLAHGDEVIVVHERHHSEATLSDDEPRTYPVEVELHGVFGPENVYANTGFGAGARFSIPVVAGHIGRVPQNLAISFGGDWVHYDSCFYSNHCLADYLMVPVAAQWNLFVSRPVSVFAEGGLFAYKGFFQDCAVNGGPGCEEPRNFGVLPTLAIGARFHVARHVSLLARIGYPTVTFGVTFL